MNAVEDAAHSAAARAYLAKFMIALQLIIYDLAKVVG